MSIYRTLLISYLLISLASVLLITSIIFSHFRDILKQDIEHKLESQAITIMQQIDTTLFERMENMASWSQLEVMQDMKIRDVDKRLSQFLYQLYTEYKGVYQQIFTVNQNNQIIASSDPYSIGMPLTRVSPWLSITLDQHRFDFKFSEIKNNLNISIPIADTFQNAQLGQLTTYFNWQEIIKLLDASVSGHSIDAVYYSMLIDHTGRIIARSSNLQMLINRFELLEYSLLKKNKSGAFSHYAHFLEQEVLIGYAHSKGYRNFPGLGWRIVILQHSQLAFAPITKIGYVLLPFLFLTLSLAALVSLWMSKRISKPIALLAKSTRDFRAGKPINLQTIKASREISELNTQFSEMINNLEQSRLDIVRVAKLAVIGEMAASMAHEVRTPLGILRSSAQILQRETELTDIGQEMTEFILSETSRLNKLVTTLLECAKPKPPKFSLHCLSDIIKHVCELLSTKIEAKAICLTLDFNIENNQLFCDREQLIQVFLNLIINAIQHLPRHGKIVISTSIENDLLVIKFCDNGSGIPDSKKHTVFDPFYTQRDKGIGLGLTVVQQIIQTHQGQIFITDNPLGGACFHVLLPRILNNK